METTQALDRFLADVERRALQMAQIATGHRDEAMDIVQDAMFTLVRRYRGRPQQEWGALFYRILQNRIRDWYRRQKVRQYWHIWFGNNSQDTTSIDNVEDPTLSDPSLQYSGSVTLKQVQQCLHDLPLRQQQVFLLRAWEGLDIAQTAKALRISSGSVKTHYARAVQKLRQAFED